jgi:hypothetical protein
MNWQRINNYGLRNKIELGMQRYQKIIGTKIHSRSMANQKNEAMIAARIINKMTSLGMPKSHKNS